MRLKLFRALFVILIVSGCAESPNSSKSEPFVKWAVFTDSTGFFRGVEPGLAPETVLEEEPWKPAISTDTLVVYRQTFSPPYEGFTLNAFLAFDAFGLFEIQADIYPPDSNAFRSAFKEASSTLTNTFGKPDSLGVKSFRWTTNSRSNNLVEITLSEAYLEGERIISLNYLEPLDEKY